MFSARDSAVADCVAVDGGGGGGYGGYGDFGGGGVGGYDGSHRDNDCSGC